MHLLLLLKKAQTLQILISEREFRAKGISSAENAETVSQEKVTSAVKLCCKYSCGGNRSEYQKIEYKNELVNNGNTGHLLCAEASDHNVVKQVYELRYTVLHHYGNRNCENPLIEGFITEIFTEYHISSLKI